MRYCGKILQSEACHRRQYGAYALHAGYLRLQTHSGCVILIDFPLQQLLHERASLLRYTYIARLVTQYCHPNVTLYHILFSQTYARIFKYMYLGRAHYFMCFFIFRLHT
jgi:hypothetical protein